MDSCLVEKNPADADQCLDVKAGTLPAGQNFLLHKERTISSKEQLRKHPLALMEEKM